MLPFTFNMIQSDWFAGIEHELVTTCRVS